MKSILSYEVMRWIRSCIQFAGSPFAINFTIRWQASKRGGSADAAGLNDMSDTV